MDYAQGQERPQKSEFLCSSRGSKPWGSRLSWGLFISICR